MSKLISRQTEYITFIQDISGSIKIARVLCIFFMIYVHIHLTDVNPLMKSIFADILGRSSVPLLSTISGVLMIGYFKQPFKNILKKRFTVLIIPLITWGVLTSAFFYLLDRTVSLDINDIFPFTHAGIAIHLAFLRDIFILLFITPFLLRLLEKNPFYLLPIIAISLFAPLEPLLLRPQILPFYAIGLFWGLYEVRVSTLTKLFALILFVATSSLVVFFKESTFVSSNWYLIDNLFLRPLCALLFWFLSHKLAKNRLSQNIIRIESFIFIVFLSHLISGRLIVGIYGKLNFQMDTTMWLMTPFLCVLTGALLHKIFNSRLFGKNLSLALAGKS